MPRHLALAACVVFCATPASALDLPPRKAGLWEIKMTFETRGGPPQVMQHCIDAATDKLMNASFGGMAKESCPKQDMKTSPGSIVIDSVCKFGNTTTTSHAVFTGDFNSGYTVKVTSQSEGGPPMPGATPGQPSNMTIEAKWTGACKAGQKPGDMIMPGGMKVNILEMPGMQRR